MANSAGVCYSFKKELLTATHNFTPTTGNTFKFALFEAAGSLTASTVTAYGSAPANANEVTASGANSGIYSAGGSAATNSSAGNLSDGTGSVAFWTPNAAVSWTGITLANSTDCALFYNSSASNKAVAIFTFGALTLTAGNFTLTMPANASGTALIRVT